MPQLSLAGPEDAILNTFQIWDDYDHPELWYECQSCGRHFSLERDDEYECPFCGSDSIAPFEWEFDDE